MFRRKTLNLAADRLAKMQLVQSTTMATATMQPETPAPVFRAPTPRLISLDALRGFDMFWILGAGQVLQSLVVAAGRPPSLAWIPEQLAHVPWDGFHFIDLVFPLFLFVIGVAIPYSLGKRCARGDSRLKIYGHVALRVAVLLVLGMMVNGSLLSYDPKQFQLSYSVLQMLALGYLVASVLFLNLRLRAQIVATATMLIGYWALLAFWPGPGHSVGTFREGCNLGDWLTEALVGKWRGGQVGWVLGILGHASTAMLGVFAGQVLRSSLPDRRKVLWLVAMGIGSLGAGLFWCGWLAEQWPYLSLWGSRWTQWPIWFPVIKNRWTSTFVLYAGGWSLLLLALFYLVIDVWGFRRWAYPFVVIGSNSIFAYMCWQLGADVFRQAAGVFLGGLKLYVGAAWYEPIAWTGAMTALWLLLWYLYRNKTFLRV
jgi:predicted acyltransferase